MVCGSHAQLCPHTSGKCISGGEVMRPWTPYLLDMQYNSEGAKPVGHALTVRSCAPRCRHLICREAFALESSCPTWPLALKGSEAMHPVAQSLWDNPLLF